MLHPDFFATREEHNLIKAELVSKYFSEWSKIMLAQTQARRDNRIAYVDLFSGPGVFDDGSLSTPIFILKAAIESEELSRRLVTVFNDVSEEETRNLQDTINALPGVGRLKNAPQVLNNEIGMELDVFLNELDQIPTLFFIDPFGYKGVSIELLRSAIERWGCECIFFFNYNRINPALDNPLVAELMDKLFGRNQANDLRSRLSTLSSPEEREAIIVQEMISSLKSIGGNVTLPFRFESVHGKRTSHYVIFVSKVYLGGKIMSHIMDKLSTFPDQIGKAGWAPRRPRQMSLLGLEDQDPRVQLSKLLLGSLVERALTVSELHAKCLEFGTYTLGNVQDVLRALEDRGEVVIDPPAQRRRKLNGTVTVGESCVVSIPKKERT